MRHEHKFDTGRKLLSYFVLFEQNLNQMEQNRTILTVLCPTMDTNIHSTIK